MDIVISLSNHRKFGRSVIYFDSNFLHATASLSAPQAVSIISLIPIFSVYTKHSTDRLHLKSIVHSMRSKIFNEFNQTARGGERDRKSRVVLFCADLICRGQHMMVIRLRACGFCIANNAFC